MATIDLERLVVSLMNHPSEDDSHHKRELKKFLRSQLHEALREQGLRIKDGKIISIECPFKTGDVLADPMHPESICIFRRPLYDDCGQHAAVFCGTQVGGSFCTADEDEIWCDVIELKPATPEQREELFDKMKENGYGFDFRLMKMLNVPKQKKQTANQERVLTQEEVERIVNRFIGKDRVERTDVYLGYTDIFDGAFYTMEIYNDAYQLINIEIHSYAFSDDGLDGPEICETIRRNMAEVLPGFKSELRRADDSLVSIDFCWR